MTGPNYARLFASGNGTFKAKRRNIPEHLKSVHDDIVELRNQRYAHNGSHASINCGVQVSFDDDAFYVNVQMTLGSHIGGRDEWEELIAFIDAHMHEQLSKKLHRLKEKTGYEWKFPTGPAPNWVGDYG